MPAATVGAFQRLTGVDLGFVPLVRSPQVDRAAAELGARAFTSGGAVHLPAGAGPVDGAEAQALLAHELAHVAQQRALGPLASEVGAHGGELEAIALAAERVMRGEAVDFPGPGGVLGSLARPGATSGLAAAGPGSGTGTTHGPAAAQPTNGLAGGLSWTPDAGFHSMTASAQQDHTADTMISEAIPPQRSTQRAPLVTPDEVYASTDDLPPVTPSIEPPEPPDFVERALSPAQLTEQLAGLRARVDDGQGTDDPQQPSGQLTAAQIAAHVSRYLSGRFVSMEDPHELDLLAGRIYDRLRSRLRTELLVDRERSGLLTEFR